MRRGRPVAGPSNHAPKPSPSPLRGVASDPFAALDSKAPPGPVDEISSRFPSLDQFSLLHDGGKFDFDAASPPIPQSRDLSQRVTEKLADDAFALPSQKTTSSPPKKLANDASVSRAQKIISSNPELQSVASPPKIVYQQTPTRSAYVSQGTMTSPTQSPGLIPGYVSSAAHRFSNTTDHHRSASLPRNQEGTSSRSQFLRLEESQSLHSKTITRNASIGASLGHHVRHSSSSRPSLETGRPSAEALESIARTKSSTSRSRPSSTYLESDMDYLREKETSGRPSFSDKRPSYSKETAVLDPGSDEETNIESNVDFLRKMEDSDTSKKDRRRSSGANKTKRTSLPSMSLSGTKNMLAGKFGDAFKRFEASTSVPPGPRTPSPLQELERRDLTPIAGSEATDGRSDDGNILEDMDNLPPEQRRELERRRLSMEEKRVADAAAEYRKRIAHRGTGPAPKSIGGITRAATIQNKVRNLLDENTGTSPVKKTAEGYGRFTGSGSSQPQSPQAANPYSKPAISRKPMVPGVSTRLPGQNELDYSKPRSQGIPSLATASKTGGGRPSAPPKPLHLNSISTGPRSEGNMNSPTHSKSLPSRPIARPDMTAQEKEDYIADFSKRFPSLSGIEMVERDIGSEQVRSEKGVRSREV
jgi:AP2-associated kinase